MQSLSSQTGSGSGERNPEQTPQGAAPAASQRKAFIFYSTWYDEIAQNLSEADQGRFLLVLTRYASKGVLPGDDIPGEICAMFGLVRPAIDADLRKYERLVEFNRQRGESKHVKVVERQQLCPENPRIKNQVSRIKNQESSSDEEDKKQEAWVVELSEVEAYWQQRGFKSDPREFFGFYELRDWKSNRGQRLTRLTWKNAACMWESKFRQDVLPARRREHAAEVEARRAELSAELRRERELRREQTMAEADDRAARAVTREQGAYMLQRARFLSGGDEDGAMELLKRAHDDQSVFRALCEGWRPQNRDTF